MEERKHSGPCTVERIRTEDAEAVRDRSKLLPRAM